MNKSTIAWAALFVVILIIGLLCRLWMLNYYGFYEPDGFFYYSVVQQTLANNFRIPSPIPLSGFPMHNPLSEKPGLIYITLIPYVAMKAVFSGLSLYTFMRLIPLVSAILEMLATYLLAYALTKNRKAALLAMLFMAILPASVLRTQATEYRGDTFVPTIFAFLLIVILRYRKINRIKSRDFIIKTAAAALLLFTGLITWVASVYIYPVLGLFILSILLLYLTKDLKKTIVISAAVCVALWIIGWILFPYIAPNYFSYLSSNRLLLNSIGEAQPPTLISLSTWFNILIFLGPLGVIAYPFVSKNAKGSEYVYLALFANLMIVALLLSLQIRWVALAAVPMAVFASYFVLKMYEGLAKTKLFEISAKSLVVIILLLTASISAATIITQPNSSNATSQFLNATSWLKNNTNKSSTVLTEWADGSLVEALANRTSYMDSVDAGQGTGDPALAAKAYNFSRFIYGNEYNFSFLNYSKPDYLLIRQIWVYKYSKAYEEEGNLSNVSLNDTNLHLFFTSNETTINSSGVSLTRVFGNNDTVIYKVILR